MTDFLIRVEDIMVASRSPDVAHDGKTQSDLESDRSVAQLSLHSLRVELRRRNLSTVGLRPALERRLAHDLSASRLVSRELRHSSAMKSPRHAVTRRNLRRPRGTISVPRRFPDSDMPSCTLPLHDGQLIGPIGNFQDLVSNDQSAKSTVRFSGVLRGRSVWIMGQEQMNVFWNVMGPCGKANLSRSAPSYNVHESAPSSALKGRAMRQLLAIEEKEDPAYSSRDGRADIEHLQLTLVEAFYCSFVAKHLVLKDMKGKNLTDPSKTWSLFCDRSQSFPLQFVAYCRYRSVGWLPRSGIKYGVDWVLYPASTKKHSHAPYCIILRIGTKPETTEIDRSWIRLQNRLRLVKNVAKTLVIASVTLKRDVDVTRSFETAFRMVQISEMTVDRWIP